MGEPKGPVHSPSFDTVPLLSLFSCCEGQVYHREALFLLLHLLAGRKAHSSLTPEPASDRKQTSLNLFSYLGSTHFPDIPEGENPHSRGLLPHFFEPLLILLRVCESGREWTDIPGMIVPSWPPPDGMGDLGSLEQP